MSNILSLDKIKGLKTPFYYYDINLLNKTLDCINEEASKYKVFETHYAVKANANPKVLTAIINKGLGVDCVSGGEIKAAVDAGCDPQKIVFAGVGKSDEEIDYALDKGIFCFNVESIAELEVINERAAAKNIVARVAFRVNPNIDARTHANITTGLAENKFGISIDELFKAFELSTSLDNINVEGLHFHIGSQILNFEPFINLCKRINQLQDELEESGYKLLHVNVGGGLGIDYSNPTENPIPNFESYFSVFNQYLELREGQKLHFELGRSVVGQCGTMISKVLYVKQGVNKQFAILDAGFTDLIRPALYDAYHFAENISSDLEAEKYDIVGPICESSDVFEKAASLNKVHRGDYIAFYSAGAYGEIMASGYNCRELPQGYSSEEF